MIWLIFVNSLVIPCNLSPDSYACAIFSLHLPAVIFHHDHRLGKHLFMVSWFQGCWFLLLLFFFFFSFSSSSLLFFLLLVFLFFFFSSSSCSCSSCFCCVVDLWLFVVCCLFLFLICLTLLKLLWWLSLFCCPCYCARLCVGWLSRAVFVLVVVIELPVEVILPLSFVEKPWKNRKNLQNQGPPLEIMEKTIGYHGKTREHHGKP